MTNDRVNDLRRQLTEKDHRINDLQRQLLEREQRVAALQREAGSVKDRATAIDDIITIDMNFNGTGTLIEVK